MVPLAAPHGGPLQTPNGNRLPVPLGGPRRCRYALRMTEHQTWMVRAGRGGAYFEDFSEHGLVALGWNRIADAPPGVSRAELKRLFRERYPEVPEKRVPATVGQVVRFQGELQVGDHVVTYDGGARRYLIGQIASGPAERDHELGLYRSVTWTAHVLRDELSERCKRGLGAISTLFALRAEVSAELESKAVALSVELAVGPTPIGLAKTSETDSEADEGPDGEFIGTHEIAEVADELLEDRLAALGWEQMEQLVAGILRAMGFQTRVSEIGPDRGVDVFASPDGLGLVEPRIFVEVKHRAGRMGSQALRSFLGGRQPGDRCLYVSTGGFSKDARYEADRSAIPLTLLTLADLRELYVQHYEKLDPETAAMVPLRRVWWPVDS